MQNFIINNNDKELSKKLKREANIILASLNPNSNEYKLEFNKFENTLKVIDCINDKNIDDIINIITKLKNTNILSPLTLKSSEFSTDLQYGCYRNIRYPHIYNYGNGAIYNANAYKLYVKNAYDDVNKSQIEFEPIIIDFKDLNIPYPFPIFISKGGIITGEYIQQCAIRKEIINKHCFTIQSVVSIPVSKIIHDNDIIYVVDHREPKLKVLQEFYDVPIKIDTKIKNMKFNIRKYIKLNK